MSLDSIDDRLESIVREHCSELESDSSIGPDDNLADLGLNSVGTIGILVAVEQTYDISLSDEDLSFKTFESIRSLWTTILKYQA
ncbi:phosphopantetheine-binding protein [Streptomyces tsukubensis]|uniref:phosphopantetheine-binding protein n=1 Tax=Streptomyces tsukubensis TaxID=83656 RepID=UPI00098EDA53|nr:phosphopantetheine-binding protein [Streptomyces tsukubensis]QFR95449.1 acyl carrier protein [Streptomyces tsukubensis]